MKNIVLGAGIVGTSSIGFIIGLFIMTNGFGEVSAKICTTRRP